MKYAGIIPPLVTPIDENENVCEQSVKKLIHFVKPHSTALMPTLSSGEGWALSEKQFVDMIRYTVKYALGLPVLAGVEYKTTKEVVEKARVAKELGVDAIVVTTPFEKNITQEEIYTHFKKIRDEIDVPIFIYNEEAISGNSIEYETIVRICKLGNIVGIKEASGNPDLTNKLIDSDLGVPIFQGWEHLCYQTNGVNGHVVPLENIDPQACSDMLENPTEENQKRVNELCEQYNITGDDWYIHLKKELQQRGIIATARVI